MDNTANIGYTMTVGGTFQTVIQNSSILKTAYISDLIIAVDINSINEFIPPTTTIAASPTEQDAAYYNATKNNPAMVLEVFAGIGGSPTIRLSAMLLWNRRPYYKDSILERLKQNNLYYILPPGNSLIARILPFNNGSALNPSYDRVDFFGAMTLSSKGRI